MTENKEIIDLEIVPETGVETSRIETANQLQDFIADCDAKSKRYAEAAMFATIKLGGLLNDIKESCKHGEWGKLFNGAEKRIKNTDKSMSCKPNATHVSHFNFTDKTAQRYMSVYTEFMSALSQRDRYYFVALQSSSYEGDEKASQLLAKATKGAETPRQMMLNLGVISDRRGANLDNDRNKAGRPRRGELSVAGAVESQPGDAEISAARKLRSLEWATIVSMAETYLADGLHLELTRGERRLFAGKLTDLAAQIITDKQ